jgi:predicted phosphoribosyltransferase
LLNPDLIEITQADRARLYLMSTSEEFHVFLRKIVEPELEKFHIALLNTDASDPNKIVAAFNLEKAAAMAWKGIENRLNIEVELYRNGSVIQEPEDSTEGIIDLGEATKDLINLF